MEEEQHVFIKFCFTVGEKILLKLLENGQWEEHKFLSDFSKVKSSVILFEDAVHLGHPLVSKTMG
jgi:hypothetical protein